MPLTAKSFTRNVEDQLLKEANVVVFHRNKTGQAQETRAYAFPCLNMHGMQTQELELGYGTGLK